MGAAALHAQEEAPLELGPAAQKFRFGEPPCPELVQLPEGQFQRPDGLLLAAAEVEADGAGVPIGHGIGIDGVGEAQLLPDLLKEAAGHAAAQGVAEDRQGEVLRGVQPIAGEHQAGVHLLGVLLDEEPLLPGPGLLLPDHVPLAPGAVPESFLQQGQQGLGAKAPGAGDDHVAGDIAAGHVGKDLVPGEGGDGLGGAQDGGGKGRAPVVGGAGGLEGLVLGGVLAHEDLLHHHPLLLLHLLLVQGRVQGDVGEHVHSQGQILVQNFGVEAGALLGGKGVQIPAHGVHLGGDVRGGPAAGALEDHVLDEMADARVGPRFIDGARVDPNADAHGPQIVHGLHDDADAVAQLCLSYQVRISFFALSCPVRPGLIDKNRGVIR